MKINYKVIDNTKFFKEPTYATDGSAGLDIYAIENVNLLPNEVKLLFTNIAIEIPTGYVGLICSRSGLALKDGIFVLNSPGIIDSSYRGEIGVILAAYNKAFEVKEGDRIAQLLIIKANEDIEFSRVTSLTPSLRNNGGFGSTGR